MKRIILLICLLLVTGQILSAQNLAFKNDNDIYYSAETDYYRPGGSIGVALAYIIEKATNAEEYTLNLWVLSNDQRYYIDKGAKALIRTTKGSIIELIQCTDKVKQDSKYLGYSGGASHTRYFVYPNYKITKNDLEAILSEGIQKVRLETTVGMKDFNYDRDILGKTLKTELDLIIKKNDFDANF